MTKDDAAYRALALINQGPIKDLDEGSKPARVMKTLLTDATRMVMESFCWSFAAGRSTTTAGTAQPGYRYSYSMPSGALVVRGLNGAFGPVSEWRIVNNCIVCNEAADTIDYTKNVDLPAWPALVAEALVQKLAADAAVVLSGEPSLTQALTEKYFVCLRNAQGADLPNERARMPLAKDYLDCRK